MKVLGSQIILSKKKKEKKFCLKAKKIQWRYYFFGNFEKLVFKLLILLNVFDLKTKQKIIL